MTASACGCSRLIRLTASLFVRSFGQLLNLTKRYYNYTKITGNQASQGHIFTITDDDDLGACAEKDAETVRSILSEKFKIPDKTGTVALSDIFPVNKEPFPAAKYAGPDLRELVYDDIADGVNDGKDEDYDIRSKEVYDEWIKSYWENHESIKEVGGGAIFGSESIAKKVMEPATTPGSPAFRDGAEHTD